MWFTALALLGATSSPVDACIALVHEPGELAESDGQETLLWRDAATGDGVVEYLVRYDGTADDFGWIVAIPGSFVDLWDGDEAHFEGLREATAPELYLVSPAESDDGGGGFASGCRGAKNDAGGLGEGQRDDTGAAGGGVDVVAEGFSGTYSWQAIEADDATALADWLDTNGWSVGETQTALDAYVEDGFSFVLIDLLPSLGDTPDGGRTLPPVAIQYGGGQLTVPTRMAQGFGDQVFSSTVWVVGDQAATVSGWSSQDGGYLEESGSSVDAGWQATLWEIGGDDATYLRSYADEAWFHDDFETAWVTRFDAMVTGDAQDVDATFELDGGTSSIQTTIDVWAARTAAVVPFLALLGLGAAARRRR